MRAEQLTCHLTPASPASQQLLTPKPSIYGMPFLLLTDEMEEALLFEFDEEAAAAATAASYPTTAASAAEQQQFETASSIISAVPSSLSRMRSVVKDAAGTHIQTETYTMHIEEVRAVA